MTFPGLSSSEQLTTQGFALQLYDGFTGLSQLQGKVLVNIANQNPPIEKADAATFLFLNIAPGDYSIEVQPSAQTPFYAAVTVSIELPMTDPLWPAYPDLSLADRSKPLDDPTQPAAYRAQRTLVTLVPTPSYPFPPGATLLRGTVLAGTVPLSGATVERIPNPAPAGSGTASAPAIVTAVSDANGEFVLFFEDVSGMGQAATIQATHPLRPSPVDVQVTLQRGATVSTQIVM